VYGTEDNLNSGIIFFYKCTQARA